MMAACSPKPDNDISHQEAQNASDLVEILREKYTIEEEDLDILYNALVTVYVRGRIVDLS